MPQEIEIGKKYWLNIVPNGEYRCPRCDHVIGERTKREEPERAQGIVTVTMKVFAVTCTACHTAHSSAEGVFGVKFDDGLRFAIPYTWLIPLEDADAEDSP